MGLPLPPFDVLLDCELVARVLDYGYETPWASGRYAPVAGTLGEKLAAATELARLAEEDVDDEVWEAARVKLDLTDEEDRRLSRGPWTLRDAAGVVREASTLTADAGWLTWRWVS